MIDPIREAEVEASIAATNAECEAESNARGRARIVYTPDAAALRVNAWARWFLRHPFALDLVSCEETNS